MRVAPPILLSSEQQEALEQCARARSLSVRLVERARIVLLAAAALEAVAKHLAGLPGRKNLIWVSGRFLMNLGSFQKHLRWNQSCQDSFSREVEAAARALSSANVAIYLIDAHQRIHPQTQVKSGGFEMTLGAGGIGYLWED
jgi:hypothetical protein